MLHEESLGGGNASGTVVRVGDTVRKPWSPSTPSVARFVDAVRAYGVDAPAMGGRDEHGRYIQEFVPGILAIEAAPLTVSELRRVGSIVRRIHDAGASYVAPADAVWQTAIPAPGDELVCHNDLAPWNLIVGERWVFIDWDAAAPSTRLWDLAYAAQAFTLSAPDRPAMDAAHDLAAFVDGYGADPALRRMLPRTIVERTAAMLDLLRSSADAGRQPWADMFATGHGDHWAAALAYVASHEDVWAQALNR